MLQGKSPLEVYHHYSVPTILQTVTRIAILKKVISLSFLGKGSPKCTPPPLRFFLYCNMEA